MQIMNNVSNHVPANATGISIIMDINEYCTVPNLKGDPKYSERGPKGDLILSKKGT